MYKGGTLRGSAMHRLLLVVTTLATLKSSVGEEPVVFLSHVPTLPIPLTASTACLTAISCVRVTVNITAVREETAISTSLIGGITLYRIGSSVPASRLNFMRSSYSTINSSSMDGSSILIHSSPGLTSYTHVSGDVHTEQGQYYVLENCGSNCHLWMELNTTNIWVPEEEPLESGEDRTTPEFLRTSSPEERSGGVTFSVMIYYSPAFEAMEKDIAGYVATMMSEINQGYENTGVDLAAELHCIDLVDVDDVGTSSEVLDRFRAAFSTVPELLNTADIAYLLTGDTLSGCGVAYFNTISFPYGLGAHACSRGGYTFGHEVGHILGLAHNAEASGGTTNSAFSDGLGYLIQPPGDTVYSGYRTLLAYYSAYHLTRVNYYSSDTALFNGMATGNATTADNHRVLELTGSRNAAVGDETGPCNPINGMWTEWETWGCGSTCGSTLTKTRARCCTNPQPLNGGNDCDGEDYEVVDEVCETGTVCPCADTGALNCTAVLFICNDPTHENNYPIAQAHCRGSCNFCPFAIDGMWTEWNEWGDCSTTCGPGNVERSRYCVNPAPTDGGIYCPGNKTEVQSCDIGECSMPVDGTWSMWSDWSMCPVTCGGADQVRNRTCEGTANGGQNCSGQNYETQTCNSIDCPVDGTWSMWSDWSMCPVTCGGADQVRNRTCEGTANGGQNCSGETYETQTCNSISCPVDGTWSMWSDWSMCSVTCGGADQVRNRTCEGTANGGQNCSGEVYEVQTCNPVDCEGSILTSQWTAWADWTGCSMTCGIGMTSRSRVCGNNSTMSDPCTGADEEAMSCNLGECPACTNILTQRQCSLIARKRKCRNLVNRENCKLRCKACDNICDNAINHNSYCNRKFVSTGRCENTRALYDCKKSCGKCASPGDWSVWSEWYPCPSCQPSNTINPAEQQRERFCNNPEPSYNGAFCDGVSLESQPCTGLPTCPE